ncbi:MAG: DUF1573 domain-containing protein [Acidobacteria bacterium]|nr:DUF1573 domain-containing protein [Acidobacteriota bacterium]
MKRSVRDVLVCCVIAVTAAVTATAADPQKKLEETLNRYYDAYIQSKWKTAEKYIDPESRDIFRSQPKPAILKYQIRNIELKPGGQQALATVGVDQEIPQFAGQVLTFNAITQWKLVKGKWYLFMAAPPPLPSVMKASQVVKPVSDNPTPDLKFDYREYDFGEKRQGDVIEIEFPFENIADHPVQVTASLVTLCNCIDVGVSKETVAPGEKADVRFKLKSDPFTFYYHQGIGVKVEPGGGQAILDIVGFLFPAADNPTLPPNAKPAPGGKKTEN